MTRVFALFMALGIGIVATCDTALSQTTSCVFTGSATNGSCVSAASSSQYLVNSRNHSAQYQLTPGGKICGGKSEDCLNIYQNVPPRGHSWHGYGYTIKAVLCTNQARPSRGSYFNFEQRGFGGTSLWWQSYDTGGSLVAYQVPPACSSGPVADFINTTTSTTYYDLNHLCAGAAASTALEVRPSSSGIPYWQSSCDINVPNVKLTIDHNTKIFNGSCRNGVAEICVAANRITITGPKAELGYEGAFVNDVIGAIANTGTDMTVEGASDNYLTIDCQQLYGQAEAGSGVNGIETAGHTGMVTIRHVWGKNCGGANGQAHTIYLSWGGNINPDPNYCHYADDVIVQDDTGDSPAIKWDDTCQNNEGVTNHITVYCTIEGTPGPNCDENEPIDFQCGGWHSVTNSYFEMYGQPGDNDQIFFSKIAWGRIGKGGCMNQPPVKNTVRFDRDIFVMDGHVYASNALDRHVTIVCGGNFSGTTRNDEYCNANATGHVAVCVTNSQIIDDTDDYPSGSTVIGNGVYTDATCSGRGPDTNTYYRGRTGTVSAGRRLACSASNWRTGHDTKCAFPFVPRYLGANQAHDTLVDDAHAAGLCGEGTSGDPIRACSL